MKYCDVFVNYYFHYILPNTNTINTYETLRKTFGYIVPVFPLHYTQVTLLHFLDTKEFQRGLQPSKQSKTCRTCVKILPVLYFLYQYFCSKLVHSQDTSNKWLMLGRFCSNNYSTKVIFKNQFWSLYPFKIYSKYIF